LKHKTIVLVIVILAMITLVMMYMKSTSKDSENIKAPLGCASQWVDDVSTLEETIDCIDNYRGKMNNTKSGRGNYNS